MKKPAPAPSKRRRQLSEADEALWEQAADSIRPLKKRKARVHSSVDEAELAMNAQVLAHAKKLSQNAGRAVVEPITPPVQTRKKVPPIAAFDASQARKIGSGKTPIERRIDLHGMRQSEAHAALRRFLFGCHADELRMVLVITGKGAPARENDGDRRLHWSEVEERGVLKRNVPLWLAEPDMRTIVVSFTSASVRHGGEGALYIHLRRRSRLG